MYKPLYICDKANNILKSSHRNRTSSEEKVTLIILEGILPQGPTIKQKKKQRSKEIEKQLVNMFFRDHA